MIVVDTNILVYLWLPGDFTIDAEKLLKKDSHWVSSILWKSEFRNVVSTFFKKEKITFDYAKEATLNAEEQMANFEYAVNSLIVLDKVKSSNCTAYDCEFIVLAEELNCKLITKDKEIINNFPNVAIDLHDYINN